MAIPIRKFGQYVLLQVHNSTGVLVFTTDSLKIDFDVRHIRGFSRAKITLTNVAPETIRSLSAVGEDLYVTLQVAQHDSELRTIAYKMYISNAMEEVVVPNSEFRMFCYSSLRKTYLENYIDVGVNKPTVKKMVAACMGASGFSGPIEYKYFPESILNYESSRPKSRRQGSVINVLSGLEKEYNFNFYTEEEKVIVMYKPDHKNVSDTDMYSSTGEIKLTTTNMRSNPKIGPATLSVTSNLDPNIRPSSILDITSLLTLGTNTDQATLEVAEQYLRDKVSGFAKYQTLSTQHKGSNWTAEWATYVAATSPTPGTTMPTTNWWT